MSVVAEFRNFTRISCWDPSGFTRCVNIDMALLPARNITRQIAQLKEGLRHSVEAAFGADARVETCGAEGMTCDEALAFIVGCSKALMEDGDFVLTVAEECDH